MKSMLKAELYFIVKRHNAEIKTFILDKVLNDREHLLQGEMSFLISKRGHEFFRPLQQINDSIQKYLLLVYYLVFRRHLYLRCVLSSSALFLMHMLKITLGSHHSDRMEFIMITFVVFRFVQN